MNVYVPPSLCQTYGRVCPYQPSFLNRLVFQVGAEPSNDCLLGTLFTVVTGVPENKVSTEPLPLLRHAVFTEVALDIVLAFLKHIVQGVQVRHTSVAVLLLSSLSVNGGDLAVCVMQSFGTAPPSEYALHLVVAQLGVAANATQVAHPVLITKTPGAPGYATAPVGVASQRLPLPLLLLFRHQALDNQSLPADCTIGLYYVVIAVAVLTLSGPAFVPVPRAGPGSTRLAPALWVSVVPARALQTLFIKAVGVLWTKPSSTLLAVALVIAVPAPHCVTQGAVAA